MPERDAAGRFAREDRRQRTAPHGTRERYQHRTDPCRCAACREANAAFQREYRREHSYDRGVVPVVVDGVVVGEQPPLFDLEAVDE